MSVTLEVPEALLAEAFAVPAADVPRHLRIELACALYSQNRLSFAKAAELAGLDRFQMGQELTRRNISRHYTADDLKADVRYGRGQ
jgi:predicted HTH domain antitoxin